MRQLPQYLVTIVLALTGHVVTATDLYVSPEGNDAWTGTLEKPSPTQTDGPLASLVGARDAIRKLKADGALQQPIRVRIQSGQYTVREPLVFEPQDSGTEQCPISYLGDPERRPIISGGTQVTGWRKQGDRWVTHLSEVEAGDSPGTVLRNNLVHDVYDHGTGSLAIYTDEGSTGILIENNIGYGTTYANFHQHFGKENIVRNNIWAFGKDYQLSRARQEEHTSFTFERNIVYFDNGKLLKGGWTNDKFIMDGNLYWDISQPDGNIKFGEATLAQWQARDHDRHSLIADPKFVNAAEHDFRLQPDSPAFQLGFVPIDTSPIGLYGDPDWVGAPRQIKRQVYVPKPPAEPQPTPVLDDFEEALLGLPPEGPTVSLETVGSILVTEQMSAQGQHSLQFTDAPGQQYSFNPHLWYAPHLVTGAVRGSFDVRIEPGAIGHFEWRDYSDGGYRIGPSVRIEADGKLLSGGQQLNKVPLSQWLRIEVTCGLGDTANGKWTLRYGPTSGTLTQLHLTCDPQFRQLDWVGFIADATVATVFYVDNIQIGPTPSP